MKIFFRVIYHEPGTSFDLSLKIFKLLSEKLSNLNITMRSLSKKNDTTNYALAFIISATQKSEHIEIFGPNIRYKAEEIEFAIHLPYRETLDFKDCITFVIDNIFQGIKDVFNNYEINSSEIDTVMKNCINEILKNPMQYTKPKGN